MDWGNDYFTFSDTNIEYIWGFLREMHARLALQGPSLDEVVPCRGTSISLTSCRAPRLPGQDRPVGSSACRCGSGTASRSSLRRRPRGRSRRTSPRPSSRTRSTSARRRLLGRARTLLRRPCDSNRARRGAGRLELRGPFDHLLAGRGRASRHPCGTRSARRGDGHRPHRAGLRRRGLRASRAKEPHLRRPHARGRGSHFYDAYGWLHGLSTASNYDQIVRDLSDRRRWSPRPRSCTATRTAGAATRRSSSASRTTSSRPRSSGSRPEANAEIAWTPEYMGKRSGRLASQHGGLETPRGGATTACRYRSTSARAGT